MTPGSDEQAQLGRGARKRAVRRDAVLEAYGRSERRRGWALPTLGGVGALLLVGGVAYGTTVLPATPAALNTGAAPAALSAATAQYVCPAAPRLPSGADEATDVDFSPLSSDASTEATVSLFSDLAGRLPGSTLRPATTAGDAHGGPEAAAASGEELTASQPDDIQQGAPATSGADGVAVRDAGAHRVGAPGGEQGLPSVVTVEPLGGQAGLGSAIAAYSASDGDLTGLDVSACTVPSHQQRLTGATTTLGSTAILVLTNPSASAATVDLRLFGAEGIIDSPGTSGLVLGPDQTRSFVLGGLAPNEENLAVEVRSSGGAVSASIQQHRLFGVMPGGVDIITPNADASQRQVVPGVSSPGADALEELNSQDDVDVAPAVQIAATGSATTAEVTALGPDGPASLGSGSVVELAANGTGSVDLSNLPAGEYTIVVEADAPVIATARSVSGAAEESVDMGLTPSASELAFEQLVSLPSHGTSQLVVYGSAAGTIEYQLVDESGSLGETQQQEVAEGDSVTLDLDDVDAPAGVHISTTDTGLFAGVIVSDGATGLSGYPVTPAAANGTGVLVRVGY
ncbi:DUF5719 family protein [Citricoccus sp. NR2]|uniref:DUF5719 family protein n=1 Tax=Citricoccus sp. NR2 TaxID=3004095 RepID=UPI0022DDE041|nr:DUF5719 family protein [Citricoccus sp. NR2]WBL18983.1 DUF5719 family protein [Citricoccus sp. NR2]